MLQAVDLLPETNTSVILFTRHSLREVVRGIGLAGYDLQLTDEGRELAFAWGEYLTHNSDRHIVNCISSPIQRCIETAELMIAGADQVHVENTHKIDILEQKLLVEPGSFVVDIKQAAPHFREQGAVGFINSFVQNALPGMKHPINGVLDVLELLYHSHLHQNHQRQSNAQLSLAVSHDTILAAFVAVISGHFQVEKKDWPEMMEGLFVWFDEAEEFKQSRLHWVWRGQHQQLDIQQLVGNMI
ncbi:MAG: histidine phosphatase family protein [Acinetobacter populi]|uniref:histidine phosphatase family protein n=1 Tax=Acinetobacter populi TaxID=1582270 RepID=UPI002357B49D|nr:phosphoglycerate mutase family protein [Acinetobacter populi]MCH4247753.1 histidine phosphatase family protein [Acinetobacter populi]